MFELDHVAIQTVDIAGGVEFYKTTFGAEVLYQDSSWAFLRLGQGKLALVRPEQHPMHVALRVTLPELEALATAHGQPIKTHRDGTRGIYMTDPDGNHIELIFYPPNAGA